MSGAGFGEHYRCCRGAGIVNRLEKKETGWMDKGTSESTKVRKGECWREREAKDFALQSLLPRPGMGLKVPASQCFLLFNKEL